MNWDKLLSAQRKERANADQKGGGMASHRSSFEQDYDRIIFSHPFRRLQDKTQVHPLPEHDFVHTRLTHSLEASSVGRSLGQNVGREIVARHPELKNIINANDIGAIVAAASLTHDLGNPPFGHAGEVALSDFFKRHPEGQAYRQRGISDEAWEDFINFEGNAQGFRILNKNQYGLRLTAVTLGAFIKYPCPAYLPNRDKTRRSQKKYGFFHTEKARMQELAQLLGFHPVPEKPFTWARHPLAFLVEAADDICYNIIDLEDGCRLGLISYEETLALLAPILGDQLKPKKLSEYSTLNERLGILRALAINKLINVMQEIFLDNENDILSATFDRSLLEASTLVKIFDDIVKLSSEKIYRARHVVEIEASGHEALQGLTQSFTRAAFCLWENENSRQYQNLALLFPEDIRLGIQKSEAPHDVIRYVLDFLSGLTDRYAISLFKKIKGHI